MITEHDGFKLLGKVIYPSLSLEHQQVALRAKLVGKLEQLDTSPLFGVNRLLAVQLGLRSWLSWELSMYDFRPPLST